MVPTPSLAVIGAGDRGTVYASWVERNPGRARLAAVVEPDRGRRERFGARFGIPVTARWATWEEFLALPRLADGLIIATPDRYHAGPALAALAAGYNVLLEKPMALDEADARRLVAASTGAGPATAVGSTGKGSLHVCHVLRYHPFFLALKEAVASGRIGEPVSLRWNENVSYWHFAHSFVRGNWRDPAISPMILAKCSHDLDLLQWLAGRAPRRVASFGGNREFHPGRAPQGAPERCVEGCPASATCPYDAVELYRAGRPLYRDAAAGRDPLA